MNRSVSLVAGIVIIVFGAFVLIRGGDFNTRREMMHVGDVKVTTSEEQTIPPWAAGLAVAAGVALVVAGARKRA
jgi:hypothetical protein